MKILLFAQSLTNSAGIERMTVSLANQLVKNGYSINIIVCGTDIKSFYELDKHITVQALGFSFNQRIKAAYNLYKLIKQIKPDVLINVAIPMGQISFISLLFLKKRPIIIGWEHFHLYAGSILGRYFRYLSAVLCNSTVVLTDSDRSKYPKILQKKIQRIYNFTTLNSQYIPRSNYKLVLTVGRLEKQKGYDLLIPIWRMVVDKINDCKLLIIGDGSMKNKLLSKIKELNLSDNVSILPPTSQIFRYYKQIPLYIMSSRYEGLPMVLIEAKTYGMACVSYDCPQGPNEIIIDGKDGYLVSMGDAEKFANCVINLLQTPQLIEQFGKSSVDDINKRFSTDVIIKQWKELFNKLI